MYWGQHHLNLNLNWIFNLNRGVTARQFISHEKDVLSVAFSADNRQIVSGAMDNTIKLWNTLGVCKYTIQVSIPYYMRRIGNLVSTIGTRHSN